MVVFTLISNWKAFAKALKFDAAVKLSQIQVNSKNDGLVFDFIPAISMPFEENGNEIIRMKAARWNSNADFSLSCFI